MLSLRAPFEENIHFGKNTLIRVADTGGAQPKSFFGSLFLFLYDLLCNFNVYLPLRVHRGTFSLLDGP